MDHAQFAVTVHTADVAATAAFYTNHFGMEVTSSTGWFVSLRRPDVPWEIAVLDRAHGSATPGTTDPPGHATLVFVSGDATADATSLTAAGVRIDVALRDEPWGQRHFHVRDPAGTLVEVVEFIDPDPEWLRANMMQP